MQFVLGNKVRGLFSHNPPPPGFPFPQEVHNRQAIKNCHKVTPGYRKFEYAFGNRFPSSGLALKQIVLKTP